MCHSHCDQSCSSPPGSAAKPLEVSDLVLRVVNPTVKGIKLPDGVYWKCGSPDCDGVFRGKTDCELHVRAHLGLRPVRCNWPGCGLAFRRNSEKNRHYNGVHLNILKYTCLYCGKGFRWGLQLERHCRDQHLDIDIEQLLADLAGDIDEERELVEAGQSIPLIPAEDEETALEPAAVSISTSPSPAAVDSPQQPAIRKIIGSAAMTQASTAMRTNPNLKRPHVCEYCGKDFPKKDRLQMHINAHLGLKPFKCSHPGCTKAYADDGSLGKHKKLHLAGPSEWICAGCEKDFRAKTNFKTHQASKKGRACLARAAAAAE